MGKLRKARSTSCAALVAAALALSTVFAGALASNASSGAYVARAALDLQGVLQNYRAGVSQAPDEYVAQLAGKVRSFFGTSAFTGVVTSTADDGVSTSTEGAPWYLPESFSGDLIDISGELDRFDLSLEGTIEREHGEHRLYHVAGVRRGDLTGGARRGEFWIRESDWRIVRCVVEYGWGKVDVDLKYDRVGEHVMLSEMDAQIRPFGVELRLLYDEYRFGL